MKHLARYICHE